MEYKRTLIDQLRFLTNHLNMTYTELSIMPTFQRNYYFDSIIEEIDKKNNGEWGQGKVDGLEQL
jgi:hypothetical protein